MGKYSIIVSLDIAKAMGVVYFKKEKFYVTTYTGTPQEQLEMLLDVLGDDVNGAGVFIEELNDFLNAKTTRSLLRRSGYLMHTLEKLGATVTPINAKSARKYCNCRNKAEVLEKFKPFGLNSDEADALAILLYGQDIKPEFVIQENIVCLSRL